MAAIFTFGKRPAPKQRSAPDTVGFNPSDLAGRFQSAAKQGGGIRAGAHPEFDQPTPFEKIGAAWGKMFGKRKGK
jgi:hypothetical protein